MALIERLMHLTDQPTSGPQELTVHGFWAAGMEILNGRATVAQVKTFYQMTPEESAEFDALIAKLPAANQVANRLLMIDGWQAVFMLAEQGVQGYDTPAGVRSKLGI